MKKESKSWIDNFIPAHKEHSIEDKKGIRIFLSLCFITASFMPLSIFFKDLHHIQHKISNYFGIFISIIFLIYPFLIKHSKQTATIIYSAFVFAISCIAFRASQDEYLYSTAILWLIPIPALSLIILNRNKSILLTTLSFATLLSVGFMHFKEIGFTFKDPQLLFTLLCVMTFSTITSYLFEREKEKAHQNYLKLAVESHRREKLAIMGEMVSGLAHEINNPLTIIVSSSHLIEKEMFSCNAESTEKVKKLNSKIYFHSARINRLISSLREYSKNESQIKKHLFCMNDFLTSLVTFRENQFKKDGIHYKLILPPKDVFINANEALLGQAFQKILDNAIDAILPLNNKWIEVEAKINRTKLDITITDSGKGIPLDIQSKLMTAFFTTKEIGKGVGIGLLLSSRYFELNDSYLSFNPESEHTQFKISIPLENLGTKFAGETVKEFNTKKVA